MIANYLKNKKGDPWWYVISAIICYKSNIGQRRSPGGSLDKVPTEQKLIEIKKVSKLVKQDNINK